MQNVETQTTTPISPEQVAEKQELLKKIYTWASKNTSEARHLLNFKYYWPKAATDLIRTLELSEGSIIVLAGLSGVGKSSAQAQVAKALNEKLASQKREGAQERKAVHFKWPGYFDSNYDEILASLKEQSVWPKGEELMELVVERLVKMRDARVLKRHLKELYGENFDWDFSFVDKGLAAYTNSEMQALVLKVMSRAKMSTEVIAKRLLGPNDLKSLHRELVISLLSNCHSILIDLRDYGMKDSRAMNTDLNEIQKLWQYMNEYLYSKKAASPELQLTSPNLVFVLQKELATTEDARPANYFLGKVARTFEIAPFARDELIRAYVEEFGSTWPFEELALLRLAYHSRGIFRQFLRYIQLSLDPYVQSLEKGEITSLSLEAMDKSLPHDEMARDTETELRQIFPYGSYWKVAFHIIIALGASEQPMTQTQLQEIVQMPDEHGQKSSVNQPAFSTIVKKLEDYGFVKRENTSSGKLVSLNT